MNRLRDIVLSGLVNAKSFLFSRNALTFLCFVVVSAVLWYGHAISSEREATLHVPIHYTGVPADVHFEPALPNRLDVTVRDAGKKLMAQSEEVPVITFDLSDQIKGSSGKVHIASEQILEKLPPSLHGNGTTKMISFSPDHIEGNYSERYNERVYTLPLEAHKVPAGYTLRLFPTQVEVTVRVSQSHYNDISAKDITVYCDFPTQGEDKLTVKHVHRSKYIKGVRFSPTEVEYLIEKNQ